QVGEDRSTLLGQACHVNDADAPALQMRGHGKDRADGDDAGAADSIHDAGPTIIDGEELRFRYAIKRVHVACDTCQLLELAAMHRDEGGAETLDAGEILIAARLVDTALASEFGLH